MATTTCLALDPGKRNFAFCVFNTDADIRALGMVSKTITELDHGRVGQQHDDFVGRLEAIYAKYRPKVVVLERYQQRPGMGGGAPAEFINVMIGVVLEFFASRGVDIVPITAATWKNYMKQRYDPKEPEPPPPPVEYEINPKTGRKRKKKVKKPKKERTPALPHCVRMGRTFGKDSKTVPIPDHQFDAAGIAQWYLETTRNMKCFVDFKEQLDQLWEDRSERKRIRKEEDRAAKKAAKGKSGAGKSARGVRAATAKPAGGNPRNAPVRVRKSGG